MSDMVNVSLRWGVKYRRLCSQSTLGRGFTLSKGEAGEEAQFKVFLEGDFSLSGDFVDNFPYTFCLKHARGRCYHSLNNPPICKNM